MSRGKGKFLRGLRDTLDRRHQRKLERAPQTQAEPTAPPGGHKVAAVRRRSQPRHPARRPRRTPPRAADPLQAAFKGIVSEPERRRLAAITWR